MTPGVTPPSPEERLIVLSEPEFAAAVAEKLDLPINTYL